MSEPPPVKVVSIGQRVIDIDPAAPDPRPTWSVFEEFCRTVEVRTPGGTPKEDDNDEPIVLDCEFRYEPADDLRRQGIWSRGSDCDASLGHFFAAVERHPFLDVASRHRVLDVGIS